MRRAGSSGVAGSPGSAARPSELGKPAVLHVDAVDRERAGSPLQGVGQRDERAGVALGLLVGLPQAVSLGKCRVVPAGGRGRLAHAVEQFEQGNDLERVALVLRRDRELARPGVLEDPRLGQ